MSAEEINTVGFPIMAAIASAGFVSFIVKWFMNRFDKMYQDHRADIKYMIDNFVARLDAISEKQKEIASDAIEIKSDIKDIKREFRK